MLELAHSWGCPKSVGQPFTFLRNRDSMGHETTKVDPAQVSDHCGRDDGGTDHLAGCGVGVAMHCIWGAGGGVIRDQEADAQQFQDMPVNCLDLVRQRVHLGGVHCQEWVIQRCKAVTVRFQSQENMPRVGSELWLNLPALHFTQLGFWQHLVDMGA